MLRIIHRRRALLFLVLHIAFLALLLAVGPQPISAQEEIEPHVTTDLVVVPFEVTDRRRQRVPDLTLNDFVLTDNGQIVNPEFFTAGAERTALVLLWDQSGSVSELVKDQQAAALSLIDRFGANAEVALVRFGTGHRVVVPFTADPQALRSEFNRPSLPAQRTAIFDAALAAVKAFETRPRNLAERRIVILLSDGLDTASTVRSRQVIDAARAAAVSFYIIHLPLYTVRGGSVVARTPSPGFRDLAIKTGGQISPTPTGRAAEAAALTGSVKIELAPLLQAIADDLNGQYMLAYYLAHDTATVGVHQPAVRISLNGRKDFNVRLLRGSFVLSTQNEPD